MKSTATHFFNKSISFLEISIISAKEKDNELYNIIEYSQVTAYLLYHSTELFLKFAIFQASDKVVKGHDIFKLYAQYKKLYLNDKWNINIPFCKDEDIDYSNFTKKEILEYKEKYSMPFEQQLKYPIDDKGEIYCPGIFYDIEVLENFKQEIINLYFEIEKLTNK